MSERRKLDIDAPLGDGLPEISPADARQVVHNVISAFVDAAPYGLSDSKYAPKNWNKENENYRSKRKVENVPARRDTMLDTRYKASDLDDTTAFVAAMERMFSRPTGVSTAGEYGAGLAGDTKSSDGANSPSPEIEKANAPETTSKAAIANEPVDAPGVHMADERSYGKAQPSSGKMTPTSSVDSNATDENEDPELMVTTFDNTELEKLRKWANVDSWDSGATLVVRVVGVNMDCGMGWLYEQATQGGRKIERILDTYSPSGPRIVMFRFQSLEHAVGFSKFVKSDENWLRCTTEYARTQ